MKKFLLLSVFAFLLSVNVVAQDDDMYFVPTKKNVEKAKKDYGMPHDTYYSGSDRSVDEYNRRIPGSSVTAIDSLGNDIINLDGEVGEYPDSLGDYTYTRKMSRWDDYEWKDGYRAGYADGRFGTWGWGGYYPYYSGWYGGWYDPWFYDPWYYGWGYAGWYNPWYYGYGWGYPHYWHNHYWGGWYPGGGIAYYRGSTGTRNHSAGRGSSNHSGYNYRRYNSVGNNRGYANNNRYNNNTNTNRNMNFGGVRNSNGNTYQNNSSFGGTRSNGGGFSGGGGSRGGGGSFGGGSRGGGGHFGGGRR